MNQGWVYSDRITPAAAGLTVLDFYTDRYRHSSRSDWQSRIEAGQIYLDERLVAAGDRLSPGQILAYHRPPWVEPAVPLTFDILHADEDIWVINKPAGLPVLPGGNFLT
ncbi:MAG: RNA pseudouridine synthase, partial [Leptolyngbyaceae cyanobacterium SM2_3_12]|nr:RNA pseudouridine synthase [Leptolyngbyaceae cyanobacterium SM2_3_12]